jgi:hypothetical protein
MVVEAGFNDTGRDSSERSTAGQDKAGSRGAGSPAGATPDLPDLSKIAQDWITLWQSEITAMAADREMRETWQTVMALWAGTMSTMLRTLHADWHERSGGQATAADPPRTTPTAAASDARDAEIERLARHVATLERRLADLERGADPPGAPKRRSARKPRK